MRIFSAFKKFWMLGIILAIALLVTAVAGQQAYQRLHFWQGCQATHPGTADITWYQGQRLSFGFPADWRGGDCTPQATDHYQVMSDKSWVWWNGQPLNAGTFEVSASKIPDATSKEFTLAKTLAAQRKEPFNGGQVFSTTRINGQDALVRERWPEGQNTYQKMMIVYTNGWSYTIHWTITATSANQLKATQQRTQSGFDHMLTSMSFFSRIP